MKTSKLDPRMVANEFLDEWERAHQREWLSDPPDYEGLTAKYAVFTGDLVSEDEAHAVARELHEGRKARGWPNPNPNTSEPSIEGAIMHLWISGMRKPSKW